MYLLKVLIVFTRLNFKFFLFILDEIDNVKQYNSFINIKKTLSNRYLQFGALSTDDKDPLTITIQSIQGDLNNIIQSQSSEGLTHQVQSPLWSLTGIGPVLDITHRSRSYTCLCILNYLLNNLMSSKANFIFAACGLFVPICQKTSADSIQLSKVLFSDTASYKHQGIWNID